ncbi:MAG: hypothetical protein NT154_41925 [Verrucomicrobia bacterium]|nr:hypothetical protein [Verrucomicrobiota bacterium]
MNALRRFFAFALLGIGLAIVPQGSGATPIVPDDRDRQVLESLLLHLLGDTSFDLTRVSTNGARIVLDANTPEKTGFLMPHQIRSEIGGRSLPGDAEIDMRRRNTPADAKPDVYDSVKACYTNLTCNMWPNKAYAVDAPVAPQFHTVASGRRATHMRRWPARPAHRETSSRGAACL